MDEILNCLYFESSQEPFTMENNLLTPFNNIWIDNCNNIGLLLHHPNILENQPLKASKLKTFLKLIERFLDTFFYDGRRQNEFDVYLGNYKHSGKDIQKLLDNYNVSTMKLVQFATIPTFCILLSLLFVFSSV